MKKIIVSMVGILALSGCSLTGGTNNVAVPSRQVPTAPAVNNYGGVPVNGGLVKTPTPGAPVANGAISIQNFSFNPAILPVKKGATVTWTNNDPYPHQIKSATFNSAQLSNGQTFSFTFNDAGTFDYSCAIHPSMTGKIIVE